MPSKSRYNRCQCCQRDMQILLNGEKSNPSYICTDCEGGLLPRKHKTLADHLSDPAHIWRAKFTSIGLKVAIRGFRINRNGPAEILHYGRALDLYIRDQPERSEEFRYSFHLNLNDGTWNRAGMSVKDKSGIYKTWFSFDTLKRYGLEAVIAK